MKARIIRWLAERKRTRELLVRFETLIDPTFLDRATAPDFELPKYNAIYSKEK